MSPGSGNRQQPARAPRAEPAGTGTLQVQVDEHGGIILDNASRTVQVRQPEDFIRREDGDYDVINSMTYMKREASSRWSAEETEEFYAVSLCTHLHISASLRTLGIPMQWVFADACMCVPSAICLVPCGLLASSHCSAEQLYAVHV